MSLSLNLTGAAAPVNPANYYGPANPARVPDARAVDFDEWCWHARGVDLEALGQSEDFADLERLYSLEDEWDDECQAALDAQVSHIPDADLYAASEREQEEHPAWCEKEGAQLIAAKRWNVAPGDRILLQGGDWIHVPAIQSLEDIELKKLEAARMAPEDGIHQLSAAEAFTEWADDVRWADDARHWLRYDGARYRPCGDSLIMARFNLLGMKLKVPAGVKGVSDLFYGDAAHGVISRARSVVPVRADEFDRNTKELVFADVRLDLETGGRKPNSADSLVTRALPWRYEHATDESRAAWQGFLAGTGLASDVAAYLQRGFGAAATGLCSEKAFFYLHGESGTAKTTFVELIARALDCYCARVSSKLFMTRRKDAGGHTDDFMSLPGARLAWCDETKEGDRFDPELVKNMTAGTGTAIMRLSGKGTPGRDVRVSFLTVFTSEHLVRVDSEDKGLFARQKIVEFRNVIPEAQRDPRFVEKNFDRMRPAIVEWLVDGARAWLATGLGQEPAAIRQAGVENQLAQDWVGALIDELYERSDCETDNIAFATIRAAVANHLKVAGRRETISDTKLGRVLTKRGFGMVERTKARTRIRPRTRH